MHGKSVSRLEDQNLEVSPSASLTFTASLAEGSEQNLNQLR